MDFVERGRDAILRGPTLQHTLIELSRLAELEVPGAVAGYTVVDATNAFVREAVFPSLPPEFQEALSFVPLSEPYLGSCVQSIRTGVPVVSNEILGDSRFDGRWRELCLRFGLKSIRSAPVKDTTTGAVGSFVLGYRDTSTDERWDVSLMAKFAHMGLEAMRLYRTLAVAGAN
jgi:hypothetical protein